MNWTDPWVPGAVTGSLALIAAVLTGIITSALQAKREERKAVRDSATPGVPTVQEIWQRQDLMERAFKASLVLVGELAEQHDNPSKLILNKSAIKTLRDSGYMPDELEEVLNLQGR